MGNEALRGLPSSERSAPELSLLRWRAGFLVESGLDELSARRLAADPHVDIHARLSIDHEVS